MKILYFDYWTNGIHNFKTIDSFLKSRGHETSLFHLGSLRNKGPEEEIINGIFCKDISSYRCNLIYKILKRESPDVLITLNAHTITDRTIVLACRRLGIRTVHLMHGVRPIGAEITQGVASLVDDYNNLFVKLRKASKYFRFDIPNYIYAHYRYDSRNIWNLRFLKAIYSNFKDPATSIYYPKYSDEIVTDKCLVYAKKYVDYYMELGFKENQIAIVGNPAYDELFSDIEKNFFDKNDLPLQVQELIEQDKPYAVYLEDGFPEQRMGKWTAAFRSKIINQIANALRRDGINLVVKLHPAAFNATIVIDNPNVFLVKKTNLNSLVYFSKFCIGHISTTINIPIILDKPIIIPQWELSANIADYYLNTKVANAWVSPESEFSLNINNESREEYKSQSISVFTAKSVRNIVLEIENGYSNG